MGLIDLQLDSPSRKKSVKILAIGNYTMLVLDVIQGLVFVPIFIHFLGNRLYGLWLGTGGILAALSFLDLGMASLNIQRVAREYGRKNFSGIGKYFFNGILISSVFMFILLIAGFIISHNLNRLFNITDKEFQVLSSAFLLAIASIIIQLQNNIVEGTLNALQKPLFGKISGIIANVSSIIITYLLLINKFSVISISIGLLIRSGFAFLPNLIYLCVLFRKNNIKIISFDGNIIKDYLTLTPSIFLSKFGTSLVGNIEPTLITMFVSPQVAVYYSVTRKVGILIKTVLDRIGGIFYPSLSHLFAENNIQKFRMYLIKLIEVLLPVSVALFSLYFLVNEIFISIWVGDKNYLGDSITLLISVSLFLSFFSNGSSYLLSTTGDIKYPAFLIFLESLTKIILLYIMLIMFGVYGLPVAIIISSTLFLIKYIIRWNMHLKIYYKLIKDPLSNVLKQNMVIIIMTLAIYLALYFNSNINEYVQIIIYFITSLMMLILLIIKNMESINIIRHG